MADLCLSCQVGAGLDAWPGISKMTAVIAVAKVVTERERIVGRRVHLSDFEGIWQVRRRIVHADGSTAEFAGIARWSPRQGGLQYTESGELVIAGQRPVKAEQRYFWGAGLDVYFDDGRYFHTVPSKGGEAAHWCPPDQYNVDYDFLNWPEFTVTWRVAGPRKDYVIVSEYISDTTGAGEGTRSSGR